MISSAILMGTVSQSANLFGQSMHALGRGQLRDSINAAIARDLEQVRHVVANWAIDPGGGIDGQLSYHPESRSATACSAGTLGKALLADNQTTLPARSLLDLSKGPSRLNGITITRTIFAPVDNPNVIQIAYFSGASSGASSSSSTSTNSLALIKTSQSTTLVPPAQAWCP